MWGFVYPSHCARVNFQHVQQRGSVDPHGPICPNALGPLPQELSQDILGEGGLLSPWAAACLTVRGLPAMLFTRGEQLADSGNIAEVRQTPVLARLLRGEARC